MPLRESSRRLLDADPANLDAFEEAIQARARDVAEFAAKATGAELLEAFQAGQQAVARLLEERARLLRELRSARDLRSGLAANTERDPSSIYC